MSFVGDFVSDIFGGGKSEEAAQDAAQISADAQREALAYLKEREAVPEAFREGALRRLGGIYGLPGGVGSMDETIERARMSPLYQEQIADINRNVTGNVLRGASATGRLRSGTVPAAIADATAEQTNRVLSDAVGREITGLGGLAGLESNAPAIANITGGIGQTLAQGQIAGAQARQDALGTGINTLAGIGGMLLL